MTKLRAIHEKGSGNSEGLMNGSPIVDTKFTLKLETLESDHWDIVELLKTNRSTSNTFHTNSDIELAFTIAEKIAMNMN